MNDDMNVLILKAQLGDKSATEQIIKKYKYLINFVTKKLKLAYSNSIEDFYQMGLIALAKAIKKYDINRGYKFTAYAQSIITNEIISFLRIHKKTYVEVYGCIDFIASNYNEDHVVEIIDLKNAMNKLSPILRNIIKLSFFDGLTQVEIASILGVERSYISSLKKSAIIELKKYLEVK